MSSTFGGLNTVIRGLNAQQVALNTMGHNVANASTPGFSRQTVNVTASAPETIYGINGAMQQGTGVVINTITRARDTFMDSQMWKGNSTLGSDQMQQSTLSQIEGIFPEPSDTGIQTILNQFAASWQNLSTDASNNTTRMAVRQNGVALVGAIQTAAQQLRDTTTDINSQLTTKVASVNQITTSILVLNKQIFNTEAAGSSPANDLRDQRDLLVDQLSTLVNVSVKEDSKGNYRVQSGQLMLVDGNGQTVLQTYTAKDTDFGYEVTKISAPGMADVQFTGGEIQGLMSMRDTTILGPKGYLSQLDTVSQFLLRDFNAIHKAGYGADGGGAPVTGTNFFGASGTDYGTAATMGTGDWLKALSVNTEIMDATSGLSKIAAKTLPTQGIPSQGDASGDNAVKLAQSFQINVTDLSLLGPGFTSPTLGPIASLNSYYASLIGGLGVQSQTAQRMTTNQQTVVNQIQTWRDSTSGVNMDEEMTNMIRFQQAYNAAARVVTTMDAMLDKLINGMATTA